MEPVTLTTERLVLGPPTAADVDAVYEACQDPEIPRWTTVPYPYERKHAEEFVTVISPAGWRDDTLYNFAVHTADGALVGSMGLVNIDRLGAPQRQAELGFWTAPGHRRRGYTVEAARAVARWAFTGLGVERLEWLAEVGNEGSRAVATGVGFTVEGVLRAKLPYGAERRDAWLGSLLPSDLGLPSATPHRPSS